METLQVFADHVDESVMDLRDGFGGLRGLGSGFTTTRERFHLAFRNLKHHAGFGKLRHAENFLPRIVEKAAPAIEGVDVLAGVFGTHGIHVQHDLLRVPREFRTDAGYRFVLARQEFLMARIDFEIVFPAIHVSVHVVAVHAFVKAFAAADQNLDSLGELLEGTFRIAAGLLELGFILPHADGGRIPGNRVLREDDHVGARFFRKRYHRLDGLEIFSRHPRKDIQLRHVNFHIYP